MFRKSVPVVQINHCLTYKRGVYVIIRHNAIRDTIAEVLSEICKDVKVEPQLLPLTGEILPAGSNTADNARTDISAVGLWQPLDRAHLDVKVFNHLAQSNAVKDLQKVYSQHQRSKKREYNARILEVEKASFTPVILAAVAELHLKQLSF